MDVTSLKKALADYREVVSIQETNSGVKACLIRRVPPTVYRDISLICKSFGLQPSGELCWAEKEKWLKCPFCSFRAKTLYGLKQHVMKRHPLDGTCPICKRSFKYPIIHFERKLDDPLHRLMFVLYSPSRAGRVEYKDEVIEMLEVD